MKKLHAIIASLYAFLCIAAMFVIPMNKYEWMLDEPEALADGLTFCGLPLDDDLEVRVISFIVLFPLIVAGGALSLKVRKVHYTAWLALALLFVWGWRFLVYYPFCPGRETY